MSPPFRGWCNWQHSGFWSRRWGFESSPPSIIDRPIGRLDLGVCPFCGFLGNPFQGAVHIGVGHRQI